MLANSPSTIVVWLSMDHRNNSGHSDSQDNRENLTTASTAFLTVTMKTTAFEASANLLLDDLPVIRDNLRKGFLETQSTVNKWVQNFKKKLDGEEDEDDFNARPARPAQGRYGQPGGGSTYGRKSGDTGRRSGDRERYDADPQVLGDDFATLQMRDDEGQYFEMTRVSNH